MNKVFFLLNLALFSCANALSQESIFSTGYGREFVSQDSSALTISIDLNRVPGKPESTGSYFLNDVLPWRNLGYYFKPTMDLNLGSGVSTAPNNITIGTPIGLVYDFSAKKTETDKYWGILSSFFEASPIVVSDNKIENALTYFSLGFHLRYSYLIDKKIILDLQAGVINANGKRLENPQKINNYGTITFPFFLNLKTWGTESKKTKTDYYRIHLKNSIKSNYIYTDSPNFKNRNYWYYSGKVEFFFCPKLAVNVTYKNGNEEPLFKYNHSLTFGLTVAK